MSLDGVFPASPLVMGRKASLERAVVGELASLFEEGKYPLKEEFAASCFFQVFRDLGFSVRCEISDDEGESGAFVVGGYGMVALVSPYYVLRSPVDERGSLNNAYMSFSMLAKEVSERLGEGALDDSFRTLTRPGALVNAYKGVVRHDLAAFQEEAFSSRAGYESPVGAPGLLERVLASPLSRLYFYASDEDVASSYRGRLVEAYLGLFAQYRGLPSVERE